MTEQHDPVTGEILGPEDEGGVGAKPTRAADGGAVAKRSGYVSDVLRMLEDGQFNADVSGELRKLAEKMESHAHNNKGLAKGKLVIELDLTLANQVFTIVPSSKVKAPVEKRIGTALFLGENGSLGRNPPGQGAMFGGRKVRDDYDGPRDTRDV